MVSVHTRFWILIGLVGISGFSQGMLLPLLAIILEQNGVPSSVNGLHATGLYIGIILASPFMERPLRKFGFKPIILIGGMLVFISLALFPFWQALWFWFILRMLIGIGDQMLHFGTQTWITSTVSAHTRGKSIAYYGLSFGLGFALGPLMTRLLSVNEALPFLVSAVVSMIVWSSMLFVKNMIPERAFDTGKQTSTVKRFVQTAKIAWVALLPGFGFGFLEASLHSIFPIYGLRLGHSVDILALIIPFFALGSLVTQIPLGVLSDRYGRKRILLFIISAGAVCFFLAALFEASTIALFILFALSGMLVGSLFSLGIAYMTDLLPQNLLPAGNLMVGITFSLGSISGPFIGGIYVDLFPNVSFFYLLSAILMLVVAALYLKKVPAAV